jgi:membrane peptidoglycan carboxypeptidase
MEIRSIAQREKLQSLVKQKKISQAQYDALIAESNFTLLPTRLPPKQAIISNRKRVSYHKEAG